MKTSFRKYFTGSALVLTALLPRPLTRACGPDLGTDGTRFALFNPQAGGMPSLEPFYYTERFLNSNVPDPRGKDYARNCEEWRHYCGGAVPARDIHTIQYDTPPDDFLAAATSGKWGTIADNAFVQYLRRPANAAALDYIVLAKRAEGIIYAPAADPWEEKREGWQWRGDEDPWTDKPGAVLPSAPPALAAIAAARCRKTPDAFLKRRYAFQALRLWYYSGARIEDSDVPGGGYMHAYADSIAYYAAHFLEGDSSVVSAWAQLYVGMSSPDDTLKDYHLVRAFDESEEKKVFAFQHLSDNDLSRLEQSRYAPECGEAIAAIRIMKNRGRSLAQIEALARSYPQSKYLPMLIGREVNKLEGWIWTPDILHFNPSNAAGWWRGEHSSQDKSGETIDTTYSYFAAKAYRKDRAYLTEVRQVVESMAQRRSLHRSFMSLAAAHLCNMDGDWRSAQHYAGLAGRDIQPEDTVRRIQLIIEQTIAEGSRPDITSTAVKARLYRHIHALQNLGLTLGARRNTWEATDDVDKRNEMLSQLMMLLCRRYAAKGDVLTAALLFNRSSAVANEYGSGPSWMGNEDTTVSYASIAYLDRAGTPADADAMLRFIHKRRKTSFERLLVPDRWAPDDFYRDLKGTMLFRDGRYAAALAVFKKIAPDFWATCYDYKSYLPKTHIANLGPMVPGAPQDSNRYRQVSKAAITADILTLRDDVRLAKTAAARARAGFRLASALYQTSYWGKAWMMFSYGKSSRELDAGQLEDQYRWAWFYFYPTGNRYRAKYYQCSEAIATFRAALRDAQVAGDREAAARAMLMLACCDKLAAQDRSEQRAYHKGIYRYGGERKDPPPSPFLIAFAKKYRNTGTYSLAFALCPDVNESLEKQ